MDRRGIRVQDYGSFSVDLDAAVIRRDGVEVAVEPQVFDLIALLCSNPGRLIGHDEIIERVWRGRTVSDSAISSRINAARRAIGDDGRAQRCIRTVRGRGFRFELTPTASSSPPASGGYVLSVSPHGYALLMNARGEHLRQDWQQTLPALVERATATHRGSVVAPRVAVFDVVDDALDCALGLIREIGTHCRTLPRAERWTVKVGLSHAAHRDGWAFALAGRLDAAARPGGLCLTAEVLDAVSADRDIEAAPMAGGPGLDEVSVLEVTRVGDTTLLAARGDTPAQMDNLEMPEPVEASIVVLPFTRIGEQAELEAFAVGLRLEIQNALAQLSGVLPMAAGTAAAHAGATSPHAARALGVRYVLQGTVRSSRRRMRLILELYDHRRGGITWSRRYEGSLDEGFEFQDEMTARVVAALDVKILSGEQARIWHGSLGSFEALRLQYSAMRDFFRMTPECMRTARAAFERVHELCPHSPSGSTWAALSHWFDLQRGWSEDRSASTAAVKHWASIAIAMEDADGQAHTALCHVHLLGREFDEALAIGEQAVSVRPSCANANGFYAHALYHCGVPDKAVYHARLAIRCSPVYPPLFGVVLAGALHARGDHEGAVAVAKEMLRVCPGDVHARLILASALANNGELAQAGCVARELKRAEPSFDVDDFLSRVPMRRDDMRAQLARNFGRALRAAADEAGFPASAATPGPRGARGTEP